MSSQADITCQECTANDTLHAFKCAYPMYVIPVATLLKLEKLTVHSELLDQGLLVPWSEEMHGKIIGISHQWLSYTEPDPYNEHFDCLTRLLVRFMNGEIPRVEDFWVHAWMFKTLGESTKKWRAALSDMYVWIDYSSMPQIQLGSIDPVVAKQAADAIISLPAYIERCSMVWVLVPVAQHKETHQTCNYGTWRERGWCRLELVSAVLAAHDTRLMVCTGPEATPWLIHPFDGPRLIPGTGRFSCCDLGHKFNGLPMECDKGRLRPVLETMIDAKVFELRLQKRYCEQTFWAALKDVFVESLPKVQLRAGSVTRVNRKLREMQKTRKEEIQTAALTGDPVQVFKAKLGWTEANDKSAQKTGLSLLHCACIANDVDVIKLLAAGAGTKINAGLRKNMPSLAYMFKGATALSVAMVYATYECVDVLLEARADQEAITSNGLTMVMSCVCKGNIKTLSQYITRGALTSGSLERVAYFFPLTAFGIAAQSSVAQAGAIKALMQARAEVTNPKMWGGESHILRMVALSEDCNQKSIKILLDAGLNVNAQMKTGSADWDCRLRAVRMLEPCAGRRVVSTLAMLDGSTPLHCACVRGDTATVRQLLEARADPAIRNRQGRTPRDCAQAFFKEVPTALEAALRGVHFTRTLLARPGPQGKDFPHTAALAVGEQPQDRPHTVADQGRADTTAAAEVGVVGQRGRSSQSAEVDSQPVEVASASGAELQNRC